MSRNCTFWGLPGAQHLHAGETKNETFEVKDDGFGI